MNSNSLIFKLSLFFIFLVGTINGLFYLQYEAQQRQIEQSFMRKFHEARGVMHHARREFLGFEQTQEQLRNILGLELLNKEVDRQAMRSIFQHREFEVYEDGNYTYLVVDRRNRQLIFRYQEDRTSLTFWLLIGVVNAMLLLFYLYLLYRLKPLKVLKDKIVAFSQGSLETMPTVIGKDEIAMLTSEFNQSITKIKTLQESRTLFLRNIMHELNTPIAKGKLICDLMEDSKNQERLYKIFNRFEHLLAEFRKIEQVTSNVMPLNRKGYRVVDILDNALDLLLLEAGAIDIAIDDEVELEVDYELFSIVLKNLIDNALKYGKNRPKLVITKESISIQSQGDKIENIAFDKIFNRAYEDSSKGLGLGLYISHAIVQKHTMHLVYHYDSGVNIFKIMW
ncbi:MAG: HAMP domain-containing histidine kinase [Campylobacterales bacterium]|nr:HAMP domain-containing histidine kinase [Campylobacterales bacterium]